MIYCLTKNVPDLAKRCAMSGSVCRLHFKELTGYSPVKYINRIKIEKACVLLECSDFSISLISDFLHFYSVSYFYKVFKAHKGVTPIDYRNKKPIAKNTRAQRRK